jgi:hypothetical protein
VAAALVAAFLVAVPALADEAVSVDIPINTVLHGDPGELIEVAVVQTGPGLECTGGVDPTNNRSEREDTDVVFVSGDAGGSVNGVESPNFVGGDIFFVSEGTTTIFVRLGIEGVFSAGFIAMLDCHEPEEPTTTTTTIVEDTTTTTHVDPPPTTITTITAPPPGCPQDPTTPCGPVDAGGGAMAAILLDDGPNGGLIMGGGILVALAVLLGGLIWSNTRKKD